MALTSVIPSLARRRRGGEESGVSNKGQTPRLARGDNIVQRGTMHAWRNRSDEPCIMSFVLIEASGSN